MIRIGDEIRLREDGPVYVLKEQVGESTYDAVYKAMRKSDGVMVVVKIAQTRNPWFDVQYTETSLEAVRKSFENEIEFLNRIGGLASEGRRHFVSLLDDGSVDGRRALAVTLCDCTLKQWDENGSEPLPGYGAFDGDLLIEWVRQMALALAAVRDLGPGDEGKKNGTSDSGGYASGQGNRSARPEAGKRVVEKGRKTALSHGFRDGPAGIRHAYGHVRNVHHRLVPPGMHHSQGGGAGRKRPGPSEAEWLTCFLY